MDEQATAFSQRFEQLRALRDSGQLPPQQFVAEVQKLHWQDASGAWYMIDPDGRVLRHDGQRWQPFAPTPPPPSAPPPASAPPASAPPASAPPASAPGLELPPGAVTKMQNLVPRALWPILPLIPSLLCGGLWFLYTFIGMFKSEGLGGVDWITPAFVVGLPLLFWLFKKPLDRLLLPLKSPLQAIPKALRLGIALALPVFLGVACTSFSTIGYGGLRISALISVLAAAVLLRY
ncbi:MAG: hypothetical protein RBT75_02365 [Anaerolineae bacterium]|jgi:hypothetical protein|nr:hypothetical protein [Anaerolineae bacterium]